MPDQAILFHDPTSEPSRAVHWFALEANIPLECHFIWLTRNQHLSPTLLAVNACHQVPALKHGNFCLAEATAIMLYLVELNQQQNQWLGDSPAERAVTHRFLSWYHSNIRLFGTVFYFLPELLMPAYKGCEPSPQAEQNRKRIQLQEVLHRLEGFLADRPHLGGTNPSMADFLFATELYALDIDPDRETLFAPFPAINRWLETMRRRPAYAEAHVCWDSLVPILRRMLTAPHRAARSPEWVAAHCERVLGLTS